MAAPPGSTTARLEEGIYRNQLKIGGIKLTADGSPQGKTVFSASLTPRRRASPVFRQHLRPTI
jgi:hypothetical protein